MQGSKDFLPLCQPFTQQLGVRRRQILLKDPLQGRWMRPASVRHPLAAAAAASTAGPQGFRDAGLQARITAAVNLLDSTGRAT